MENKGEEEVGFWLAGGVKCMTVCGKRRIVRSKKTERHIITKLLCKCMLSPVWFLCVIK